MANSHILWCRIWSHLTFWWPAFMWFFSLVLTSLIGTFVYHFASAFGQRALGEEGNGWDLVRFAYHLIKKLAVNAGTAGGAYVPQDFKAVLQDPAAAADQFSGRFPY